jgi:DNA processing protein
MVTTNSSRIKAIPTQEKLNWLRLARSENIGKSTFFRLIEIFGSASKALDNVEDFARKGGLSRKIRVCSPFEAEAELEHSKQFGAEILLLHDDRYPRLLRHIPDPAPILTVKGDIEFFDRDIIAIVGPRNASFNGIAFAKKIALELGQNSIVTASGMARGVDTAAHEASILSGTIAVIAGGINHIYPQENKKLYEMVCKNGLVMTENAYNFAPKGGHFVQRNRLISGIALGVVVVEAGIKSGSLTTAKFAIDQGREVFAMPGSPFDPRSHGTNRLIKDGAKMLETIDDILEELASLKARFSDTKCLREPEPAKFKGPAQKMPGDHDIKKARQEIFTKLTFEPIPIEEIILATELPPRLVNIALVQLELADKIAVSFGKAALKPKQ